MNPLPSPLTVEESPRRRDRRSAYGGGLGEGDLPHKTRQSTLTHDTQTAVISSAPSAPSAVNAVPRGNPGGVQRGLPPAPALSLSKGRGLGGVPQYVTGRAGGKRNAAPCSPHKTRQPTLTHDTETGDRSDLLRVLGALCGESGSSTLNATILKTLTLYRSFTLDPAPRIGLSLSNVGREFSDSSKEAYRDPRPRTPVTPSRGIDP